MTKALSCLLLTFHVFYNCESFDLNRRHRLTPCGALAELMRQAGYTVKDCSYRDPFVYWRIEYHMTWEAAKIACGQIPGGNLASVHNFDEKLTVHSLSQGSDISPDGKGLGIWIGLSTSENNTWVWSDRSEMDYTEWLTDQPRNRSSQECGNVRSFADWESHALSIGWVSQPCSERMRAICKVPRFGISSAQESTILGS